MKVRLSLSAHEAVWNSSCYKRNVNRKCRVSLHSKQSLLFFPPLKRSLFLTRMVHLLSISVEIADANSSDVGP